MFYVSLYLLEMHPLFNILIDDAESHISLAMALVSLSPILLMVRFLPVQSILKLKLVKPAYASLVVVTREIVVIEMWAGQWICEGVNWLLKRLVKQERPIGAD